MTKFAIDLLEYYDRRKRLLPWRTDPTPYHVWLSEVMLQQTRVEKVKPFYFAFLFSFPSIKSLSEAPEEEVLKKWEGLGYYSRARNLKKGAEYVMKEFGGELPSSKDQLLKIPGIGEYTASSISAMAFDLPEIALDGNLLRIFARFGATARSYDDPQVKKDAFDFYKRHLPSSRCGDFNQALMELGETICLPNGRPQCEICPFADDCLAHRGGKEALFPLPKAQKERKKVSLNVFLFLHQGKVVIRRRGEKGLLQGAYEFPNCPSEVSCEEALKLYRVTGDLRPLGKGKHRFSHLEWEMSWHLVECENPPKGEGLILVDIPSLHSKYMLPNAFTNFCKKKGILGY